MKPLSLLRSSGITLQQLPSKAPQCCGLQPPVVTAGVVLTCKCCREMLCEFSEVARTKYHKWGRLKPQTFPPAVLETRVIRNQDVGRAMHSPKAQEGKCPSLPLPVCDCCWQSLASLNPCLHSHMVSPCSSGSKFASSHCGNDPSRFRANPSRT